MMDDELLPEDEWNDAQEEAPISNRKFPKITRTVIAMLFLLLAGFAGGYEAHGISSFQRAVSSIPLIGDNLDASPDPSVDFTDYWKVYNALNSDYVITHASSTIPTAKEKMWGAIQGLTSSYGDPYTVFFPPVQAKQFQDNISGTFGGIGLEIGENATNTLIVIAPLKGTPADKAGFMTGDLIVAINGKSTQGVSSDDAVNLIRGPKGSYVTISIVRNGKESDIKVMRDTIEVPESKYGLDKKTGVYTIALYEFTANSAQLFETAFTAFKASGSKNLVIDLRGNPGGYLDAAVAIASHFLPKGANIVTEDYKGHQTNDVLTSTGTNDVPAGTKTVILLNQGSASASEILAGALKDNHVATLIGTRSFGKGSVQTLINIDGGSLKVTIARWLTPAGINIMGNGITPDINIEASTTEIAAGRDGQMERAVQFLTTGK